MWELDNQTPFAADRAWVRDRDGSEVWIVAVKATFEIRPDGTTRIAESQEEVCRSPKYRGEPGRSSLLYDSDLVRTKPATDILANCHAYAPYGRTTPHIDVTLKVADIAKTLRVWGDRMWKIGILSAGVSSPEPFERMPIVYERAFCETHSK